MYAFYSSFRKKIILFYVCITFIILNENALSSCCSLQLLRAKRDSNVTNVINGVRARAPCRFFFNYHFYNARAERGDAGAVCHLTTSFIYDLTQLQLLRLIMYTVCGGVACTNSRQALYSYSWKELASNTYYILAHEESVHVCIFSNAKPTRLTRETWYRVSTYIHQKQLH